MGFLKNLISGFSLKRLKINMVSKGKLKSLTKLGRQKNIIKSIGNSNLEILDASEISSKMNLTLDISGLDEISNVPVAQKDHAAFSLKKFLKEFTQSKDADLTRESSERD